MEGVRILASEAIYGYNNVYISLGIICLIFGILALVAVLSELGFGTWTEIIVFFFIGVVLIAASFKSFSAYEDSETYKYTAYKIVFEQNVSMEDFLNTYEILDQDGEILIVKLIEEELNE